MFATIVRILTIFLLVAMLGYGLLPPQQPLSPQSNDILGNSTIAIQETTTQYRILGFLPHWNVKKITQTSLSTITDLAYFALELDELGEIVKMSNPSEEHPGWTNWKRFLNNSELQHLPLTLTLQMLNEKEIEYLLSSPTSRQKAIANILNLAKDHNLSGINIDFEPTGAVPPSTKDNFTIFIEELTTNKHKLRLNHLNLSVDVYPTIQGKNRLWDLPRLAPLLDYIVVMGYDYHYRGSDTAGPVSPLRGEGTHFNDDLVTNLKEISQIFPSTKIVLGIPFYGYKWKTTTTDKYSPTIGSGVTATQLQIEEYLSNRDSVLHWDRDSLTPYLTLSQKGSISQIYFENSLSLSLKLDLVQASRYQGIAIWALGYEGEDSPLWKTVKEKLK